MNTHHISLAIALLVSGLLCASVEAQPVIEGEDIVNASDDLREALYERHELQQRLQDLQGETERLLRELRAVEEIVALQKQLDEFNSKMERADRAGQDRLAEHFEQQAARVSSKLRRRQELRELEEYALHVREVSEYLSEERPEARQLLEKLAGSLQTIQELHRAKLKHYRQGTAERDLPGPVKATLKRLSDRVEDDDELIELATGLVEASEEEADEEVEGLLEEIHELFSEQRRPEQAQRGDETIDPLRLPVLINKESLAPFREVNFQATVVPLLQKHCLGCHGHDAASGDMNIEQLIEQSPLVVNRQRWINVIEQVKNRAMPPEDGDPLAEADRRTLVLSLHNAIYNFDYSSVRDPGYETARRLTHSEYDNTLSELLGVKIQLAQEFPTELTGSSGFDNSANTLFVQPLLMERYIGAADWIIDTLLPPRPASERQRIVYRTVFFEEPTAAKAEPQVAQAILERFVERAYRRPLRSSEKEQLLQNYHRARAAGLSHHEAVKGILRVTLISPNFLMKSERLVDSEEAYPVTDWELASRLSYFLWASMPDQELLDLASAGKLHDRATLATQVDRMIEDPRSSTLGSLFAAQWLGSQHLGTRVRMDPIDNPWCTESLMEAMRKETAMFFHSLVRENAPIQRLVDGDFTYLNHELAKLYGITGVRGDQMRRVNLEDNSQRGGIFGQGSLLAVTSFPYRTSPVARGQWILDAVLGTPPPPPPPNVSEFSDEVAENRRLTMREKLEKHRSSPNCYACHSQMDPLGISLENYDWFGRYRERYGRRRIDSVGHLPDGTEFQGLNGLKRVVVEKRLGDLRRQLAAKMLSYALGRQLEYYDEQAVRTILSRVRDQGDRFRPLVHEIVMSYPFRYKKNVPANDTVGITE